MKEYYLSDTTDADFDFVYNLKKVAYWEYIEQIWGWDDTFQLKYQKENWSGGTKLIKAGIIPIGSIDMKESVESIFISGLYLLPQYQGKGIGTKIFSELITEATLKKKRLELEVLRVNTKAIKFYERLGFYFEDRDHVKLFGYRQHAEA